MKISIVAFTDCGFRLGEKISANLQSDGNLVQCQQSGSGRISLREWTSEAFTSSDALVFIGAVGIAVRAISPHMQSKISDPAVIAVDETARFAVSVLSGHVGGANRLTNQIAALLGATPVVTTATDNRGIFAVDTWAVSNGMAIKNAQQIKAVSSALLRHDVVGLCSEFEVNGALPDTIQLQPHDYKLYIGIRKDKTDALHLIPRIVTIGLGCKKGTTVAQIETAISYMLEREKIMPQAIKRVCSIDIKANEQGILDYCEKYGIAFNTYSAEKLSEVAGDFTESDFVRDTVGIGNVCERAALVDGGTLIAAKFALDGVTVAISVQKYIVSFGENINE